MSASGVAYWDDTTKSWIAVTTALPLPVSTSAGEAGATEAKQDTMVASLSVMDDWDESDRAKVNPIAGQAGVAAAAGTVSALTQRTVAGGASTATQTSVDSVTTAGGVTILAANTGRLGATITNTDANALYLYFGAAGSASSSVYNVQLLTGETLYIDPGGYSGVIAGIWAADGSGAAKVCEFTT